MDCIVNIWQGVKNNNKNNLIIELESHSHFHVINSKMYPTWYTSRVTVYDGVITAYMYVLVCLFFTIAPEG